MKDKYYSLISRLLFLIAAAMFVLAVSEWTIQWFGYTFKWLIYEPGRLFELAAVMAIFVITLLLRQIRDILKSK